MATTMPVPYYQSPDGRAVLYCGDCLDVMHEMYAESVDAVVTDPPYHLMDIGRTFQGQGGSIDPRTGRERSNKRQRGFMGKEWDGTGISFDPATWDSVLRVAKPGTHLLAFGGTRTFHRIMVAIEDAGWEIRDALCWLYGQGFPKSADVSKAIDKAAGAEREDLGRHPNWRDGKRDNGQSMGRVPNEARITTPATDAARQWAGWGTALKPAWEPVILSRKKLVGTVAANVQRYGTGAINVDSCRIGMSGGTRKGTYPNKPSVTTYGNGLNGACEIEDIGAGRFPANLVLSHAECNGECMPGCPVRMLDEQSGERRDGWAGGSDKPGCFQQGVSHTVPHHGFGSGGGASRFFYCPKASRRERNAGLEGMPEHVTSKSAYSDKGVWGCRECRRTACTGRHGKRMQCTNCGSLDMGWIPERNDGSGTVGKSVPKVNAHPTVKPINLMTWLCRLVTPPGGIILDPFTGSGSTGVAALREGFRFLGIEQSSEYCAIAARRLHEAATATPLFQESPCAT